MDTGLEKFIFFPDVILPEMFQPRQSAGVTRTNGRLMRSASSCCRQLEIRSLSNLGEAQRNQLVIAVSSLLVCHAPHIEYLKGYQAKMFRVNAGIGKTSRPALLDICFQSKLSLSVQNSNIGFMHR